MGFSVVGRQRDGAGVHPVGFRVPCILRWPVKVPADSASFPGWRNPSITEQLLKGVKLGDPTYKRHLDDYNQMAAITGKRPSALGESTSVRCGSGR